MCIKDRSCFIYAKNRDGKRLCDFAEASTKTPIWPEKQTFNETLVHAERYWKTRALTQQSITAFSLLQYLAHYNGQLPPRKAHPEKHIKQGHLTFQNLGIACFLIPIERLLFFCRISQAHVPLFKKEINFRASFFAGVNLPQEGQCLSTTAEDLTLYF